MSWKNGSAFDGNYFFRTKLVEGEHSFYFTATDGMADAVGTPTKQDGFVLDVEKTDDIGGINPLTADVVGGIIVLALILGWFKIVMRNNKEKKE